jgi:Cation transport ATPase
MNSKVRLFPLEPILLGDLMQQYQQLSADGFRVLAVAHKHLDTQPLIARRMSAT